MAPRWPKRGQGVRIGGEATNAIKVPFSHGVGVQGVKMRPRFIQDGTTVGGERTPRGSQDEAVVSPTWCLVEAR